MLIENIARFNCLGHFNPGMCSPPRSSGQKRQEQDYLDLYIIHRFDYDTPIEAMQP